MALLQATPSGVAPSGAAPGDMVQTNGGQYLVTQPGAFGASYNPASELWSVPVSGSSDISAPSVINQYLTNAQAYARANSELSESYAQRQMDFQDSQAARAMAFSAQSAEQAARFNREAAREAMEYNALEAQKSRDWQAEMSNSSYQRAVKDLMAAGLNPVLAAMHSGASTPSGATASGYAAQSPSASGVSSSGASGTVDTSYNALLGSVIGHLMSRQTTLDSYQLQQAISQYTADSSRLAALGSASISAASAQAINQANIDLQKYLNRENFRQQKFYKENYPSNDVELLVNLLNGYSTGFNNGNLSSRFVGAAEKDVTALYKYIANTWRR